MAIAQYLLTSETSASFSVTVPATTAGNTVAIAVLFRANSSGGAGSASVTMSGATFTTQVDHSYGYNRGFIFTAPNISSGGVTSFNFAGNGTPVVVFVTYVEISGVGSSPTITANTNTGADTAPNVSVTAPSGDSDYVAFLGSSVGTNPTLSGLTSGWSLTQTNGRGSGYKTSSASGYQSLSGTLSASTNWHGGMVSITAPPTAKSGSDTASGSDASSGTATVSPSIHRQDDFRGQDDTAWRSDNWGTTGGTDGFSTAQIMNAAGRLRAGGAGGYADRIYKPVNYASLADFEVRFDTMYWTGQEIFPQFWCRANSTATTGYQFRIYADRLEVLNGSTSLASDYTSTQSATVWNSVRIRVQGDNLKVRRWVRGDSEPTSWNLDVTNSDISAAGYTLLAAGGGNAAYTYGYFQNFTLTEVSETPKSSTDTGTGSDAGSLQVESTGADTSAGADTEALSASLTDADTASGVDDGLADADLSDGDTAPSTEEGWLTDRPVSGSDTATGTDAGTLAVAVSSSDTASAVDETSVKGFGDTETALAVEGGTVLAAIADADTASDVEAESPIGITDSDAASAAAADVVSFVDYSYKFNPPGIQGCRDPEHPLFRRIPHLVGVSVLKIGGTYRQVEIPGDEDFAAATETYLGGHDTVVHQATADALTAAGYGAYLTRF